MIKNLAAAYRARTNDYGHAPLSRRDKDLQYRMRGGNLWPYALLTALCFLLLAMA